MPRVPLRHGEGEQGPSDRASEGLAALSLDALSSVAYGPEAIVVVLIAAGTDALTAALPITLVITVLLAVLVVSYRQVIAVHPDGGGAYAVAKKDLGADDEPAGGGQPGGGLRADRGRQPGRRGRQPGLGVPLPLRPPAARSAWPGWCCSPLVNLRGVAESARVLMLPTLLFIVAIFGVIVARHAPRAPAGDGRHRSSRCRSPRRWACCSS